MKLKHRTTREHYEKYRDLAKRAGVTLENVGPVYMGYNVVPCNFALTGEVGCKRCWGCKFLQDQWLNSVDLSAFDAAVHSYWMLQGKKVVKTLAEGVCMYKHLVIYQIVKAEPEFTDEQE